MTLRADFSLHLGDLDLELGLTVAAGEVTAVLGPNGAGKTTLLRAIAGHLAIDTGVISLDGTTLDEPPGVFVPPERRNLGIVHQDHLLFPHLTALDNVAFPARARGVPTRAARARAAALLERVGVADQATSKPRRLSGGQAQRVALARALAAEPTALLLDEPLAALDVGTRSAVRRDLRRYLADFAGPTILVTHDPVDALALADGIAIVEGGRVTQSGTLTEVTARPRSPYVAELIGTNLVSGTATGTTIRIDGDAQRGAATLATPSLTTAEAHDGPVLVTIAPSAVALHRGEPDGSPRNRWATAVEHLEILGARVRVHLGPPLPLVAEITATASAELDLREGSPVWVSVKATEVGVYLE